MALEKVSRAFCFVKSNRLFSRGACKVYAYVLRPNNICSESGVQCNDEFGISLDRGSFTFSSGMYASRVPSLAVTNNIGRRWNRVTLLVRLNNPTNTANGQLSL
jgi:hypothetical protein